MKIAREAFFTERTYHVWTATTVRVVKECSACFKCLINTVYSVSFTSNSITYEFYDGVTFNPQVSNFIVIPPLPSSGATGNSNNPSKLYEKLLVDSDFFNVTTSNCTEQVADGFLTVTTTDSKLSFVFSNIGSNSYCMFDVLLKEPIFMSVPGKKITLPVQYSITVTKNASLIDSAKLTSTGVEVSKIVLLSLGMTFNQVFSLLACLMGSSILIDFLTLSQGKHLMEVFNIIQRFTVSVDMQVKIY